MLKKTLLVSCFGLLLVGQNVQAGESAQHGLIGGAAGGAILGQVIGRDTKGTLIGTAIGGMLGYLAGSEAEQRGPAPVVYRSQPVYYQQYAPPQVMIRTEIIDRDRRDRREHRGYGRSHHRDSRRHSDGAGFYPGQQVVIYR